MIPVRVIGATRTLGPPPNWAQEHDGPCSRLVIRDEKTNEGGNTMISAWQPTSEELLRLINGASVYLGILGTAHPPVYLAVGEAAAGE